ncbi:beta-ketoacyl synthase N-terminal-like domain-containing protein [Allokutzneria sp. NRRL B-24872]|uniref:beta-ketoacyl synthase N-terminal-like domain-containing protein n=1 Tax=Allokutzneria sp. NRRL B-24872 TaxID=1137961 RepID=UPI00143D2F8B|nr:beta-ketoacyl synthase N-terminal-like domain-containing protein [Allokutzneria sp. NRRL B-24872]
MSARDERIAIVSVAHRQPGAGQPGFDSALFGIDAADLDAARRVSLELAWEVLERGGLDPTTAREGRTGAYGCAGAELASAFRLAGPAITVDTAHTPLIAVHMAARALREDECELAIAGGATTTDGAAMLVLERLSDARRHGHPVVAVIIASAVGSTVERANDAALRVAGLDPSEVDGLAGLHALTPDLPGVVGISSPPGATGASLVLEPVRSSVELGAAVELPDTPLLLSAANRAGLRAQVLRLLDHLEADEDTNLTDTAYSLATSRAALPLRISVVGDRHEVLDELTAIAASELDVTRAGQVSPSYFCTGEAPPAFGRELHAEFPVFAEAFDEVCAEFDALLDQPVQDVVFELEEPEADYERAATFAVEVALHRLAEHWGLLLDRVEGRGVGEISAAYCTGELSLAQACVRVLAADSEVVPLSRLDLGPLAVLSTMPEIAFGTAPSTARVALLHPDEAEARSLVTGFAQLHDRGVELDWAEFFAGTGARRVDLPTYPFQHVTVPSRPQGELWRGTPESGTWLVVTAADCADEPLTGALRDALARDGAVVRSMEAGPWNREQFAEHLRAALGDEAPDGVLAMAGVETDVLVLAMGDAEIDARLWRLAPALRVNSGAARRGPRGAFCHRGRR